MPLDAGTRLADALDKAHRAGIVHSAVTEAKPLTEKGTSAGVTR